MSINPLELAATLVTLVSVVLSALRSLWQFPVGMAGVALFFAVALQAGIWATAVLQVFFFSVLAYGWWFWLRGDEGRQPRFRRTPAWVLVCGSALAVVLALALTPALDAWTPSNAPLAEACVFMLSVFAQLLLDRKHVETWPVWIAVNILSVWLFWSQGLWLFMGLYVFFIFNAVWGWREWRRAMLRQDEA